MTIVPKIVDSFKSPDFDVDFFVSEALRDSSNKFVHDQLELCESIVRAQIRNEVKCCTDIIVSAATVSDGSLGVLLSVREHLVSARHTLSSLKDAESKRYSVIETTRAKLMKAVEMSKITRKLSKLSTDVERLRAQFPSELHFNKSDTAEVVSKSCELLSQVESLRGHEELKGLERVQIAKPDVEWLRSLLSMFKDQAVHQLRNVVFASSSLAGRDVLAVSKGVQVLHNLNCLREETNNLVESLVESFSKKHMMFLDKMNQELKQSSITLQGNSDKALNLFWELLDSTLAAVAAMIAQVSLLEAVCSLGTDPSTGTAYRMTWERTSPTELTELAWAFFAKNLTQRVSEVADKLPKVKAAMRAADYLNSGIEKISEEARHARNEVFDLVEAGTSARVQDKQDSSQVFPVNVVVDRLKQILR